MLYIQKKQEPDSLTKYRKQRFAHFDGYPNKDDIRRQLLEEQDHLCAYCMRRIDQEHMKIEHWYPEDRLTDKERLEYKNMLGVCEGHIAGSKGADDTCDAHKGNELIVVNPQERSTVDKIKYRTATGEIYSEDASIQKDLHITLNLNSEKHQLKKNRKDTLDAVIREMRKLQQNGVWNRKIMESMLSFYESTHSGGMKKEYAGIVIWYLQKKLNTTQ